MTIRCAVFCCLVAGVVVGHAVQSAESRSGTGFLATEPVFDAEVYIERWGDPENPPVVLVHGLGDSGARDWLHLAPQLAGNYHVLTFDLPGFGRSEKGNELYSPDNYTHFVRWATETYVDRPFALVGHSMGGAIALNYAARYPDHLNRLILIDAAGILHRVAFSTHLFDELKPAWWWDIVPATNSGKLRALIGIDIMDLERLAFPVNMLLHTPASRRVFLGGDANRIAGLALVQHDFSGLLERVTAPTLIIWGERDPVAPLRTGQLLAARIADARLEVIRGAGHVPMRKTPGELNRLIIAELAGKSDGAGEKSPPRESTAATDTVRSGECLDEDGYVFRGTYTTVTIVGCKHVRIENATIEFLEIRASSVEMINSRIGHADRAMDIDNSILIATASDFSAEIPIVISNSRLDFAGTTITAGSRPVQATGTSTALFSISELRSAGVRRRLHGVFWLSETQNLQ